MEKINIANLLKNTVSISSFNKGQAGKIFSDVKKNGTKIVMKNNEPECVLISPDEYIEIIEMIEDIKLSAIVEERIKNSNGETYTFDEIMKESGITENDLEGYEDIELE